MDIISISNYVVVLASFITPIILLPQIMHVISLKEANAVSLLTLYGLFIFASKYFYQYFSTQSATNNDWYVT
jgi:lipid-A-disaccharide synthase-like uncharacterized protein